MNRAPLASIPVEQVEWLEVVTGGRRWKPYPEYRESNIEWLGRVPVGWTIDRLKWTTAGSRNGIWGSEPDAQNDIICVRVADFDRTGFSVWIDDPTVRAVLPNERRGRVLQRGDLLIEKSGGGDLQPVGVVVQFDHDEPAVCSNFVARVLVPPAFDSRYLVYLHAHLYAGRVNTRSIKQTTGIQNLDATAYFDEGVAWPPLPEQRAIGAFLDGKTRQIGELIEKKRRLIELLQEKRTALISHAVTKGLNPDAPMKPSGIIWLGDVPEHWAVAPLYAKYSVELGKMLDAKRITGEHLVPYLRNVDVRWDSVRVDDLPEMDIEPREYPRFILEAGDMVVCEGGEVGRAAFWRGELPLCAYQKAIHRIRPSDATRDYPRFLYYVMYAASKVGVFISGGNPNTIPHLTGEALRVYRFAFPPLAEQRAIVAHLDSACARFEALTATAEAATVRLTEYRQALISAAVTGKIDVRMEELA